MAPLRSWLAACRHGQVVLAPCCVLVGSSYARFDAQSGPGFLADVVVTASALAAGVGVNLIDHAWELAGTSATDEDLVAEPLAPVGVVESAGAGVAAIALAALCGFGLVRLSGSAALGYGALAVILGVARGAPAIGLDTLGWRLGELASFIALGPLAALAGFASQTGSGSGGAFLAGLPAGLVAVSALSGRRTASLELGAGDRRGNAIALPLVAAAAVAIAVRAGEYGPWSGIATLPMAVTAAAAWRLPASPTDGDLAHWARLALACSIAGLLAIAITLRIVSPV